MVESVAGGGGAKVSFPMSSIMSESADPVVLGLEVVRSDSGQESPAMAASRLSPIIGVREKLKLFENTGTIPRVRMEVQRRGKRKLTRKDHRIITMTSETGSGRITFFAEMVKLMSRQNDSWDFSMA